jgi:hypothetical protein
MNTSQLSKKFWKLQRAHGKVPREVVKLMTGLLDREIAEDHRKSKDEAKARRQARYDERAARAKAHDEEYEALIEEPQVPTTPADITI